MTEKRKTNRLVGKEPQRVNITCAGNLEDVMVRDVSMGGMKIECTHPLEIGHEVYGQIAILQGRGGFYVEGKVTRVEHQDGIWMAAVKFDRVRTFDYRNNPLPPKRTLS